MIEENIRFVEKYENPANVPECPPIELFWAHLKRLVNDGGWKAKTLPELEKKIKVCIKKVKQDLLDNLFDGMIRRLEDTGRNGVIENK